MLHIGLLGQPIRKLQSPSINIHRIHFIQHFIEDDLLQNTCIFDKVLTQG